MRRRYLITGRVQGVGYRYFARRVAGRLGVTGWVRNVPDGQVEAEGQGSAEALATFETELRRGPTGSLVIDFSSSEVLDESDSASGFAIR